MFTTPECLTGSLNHTEALHQIKRSTKIIEQMSKSLNDATFALSQFSEKYTGTLYQITRWKTFSQIAGMLNYTLFLN